MLLRHIEKSKEKEKETEFKSLFCSMGTSRYIAVFKVIRLTTPTKLNEFVIQLW